VSKQLAQGCYPMEQWHDPGIEVDMWLQSHTFDRIYQLQFNALAIIQ